MEFLKQFKFEKFNNNQGLIILILIILAYFSLSFIKLKSDNDIQKQNSVLIVGKLDTLINSINKNMSETNYNMNLMIQGKLNTLDYNHAMDIISKTYSRSRSRIITDLMNTMQKNHINIPERQKIIKGRFDANISNYYLDDINTLGSYYYKNHPLNEAMNSIEPLELSEEITTFLFNNSNRPHEEIINDVINIINSKFDNYYSQTCERYSKIQ